MSEEQQGVTFIDGLVVKRPHENAPDFVKLNLFIKSKELVGFLKEHTDERGWCNIDIKKSKAGKLYAALNTFKPQQQEQKEEDPLAEVDW